MYSGQHQYQSRGYTKFPSVGFNMIILYSVMTIFRCLKDRFVYFSDSITGSIPGDI